MCKLPSIFLMLLLSLAAGAQQDLASGTQTSLTYVIPANASGWTGSDDIEDLREQLELAFSAGTDSYDMEIELVPETSTLRLQTSSERKQSKMIPPANSFRYT